VFDDDLADPGYDVDAQRCGRMRSVIIVAAAGNDGSNAVLEYPAAETSTHGLAAVGASAANARRANFSNYGSWVRFAAPGDGITSSIPGGGYGTWSGTSMAAPLFAGTAALLREMYPAMKPDEVLRRMGSRSSALCGTNLRQIDAVAALKDVNPPNPVCR
jgi:subtilisin family serine protease